MIYGHLNIGAGKPEYKQPPEPGFFERMYQGDEGPIWLCEWWDGEKWFYCKGGMPARTQGREWRECK